MHDVGRSRLGELEAARDGREFRLRELHEREIPGTHLRVTGTTGRDVELVRKHREVHQLLEIDLLHGAVPLHGVGRKHGLDFAILQLDARLKRVVAVVGAVVRDLVLAGDVVPLLDGEFDATLVEVLRIAADGAQLGQLGQIQVGLAGAEVHAPPGNVVVVTDGRTARDGREREVHAAADHLFGQGGEDAVGLLRLAHGELVTVGVIEVGTLHSLVLFRHFPHDGTALIAVPRLAELVGLEVAVRIQVDVLLHERRELVVEFLGDELLDNLGVEAVLGVEEAHARVAGIDHVIDHVLAGAHHGDGVAGLVGEVAAGAGISLVEDEGLVDAVDVAGAVGEHALGDLPGLGGVVRQEADGHLQLEGVRELGPLLHVTVVDDVLLGHDDLGVILEDLDILVQFLDEEVEQVLDVVVLRGQRAAVAVLGGLGVLDVAGDVDGVDGAIDGQDTAHRGIGLGILAVVRLDEALDVILVGEHRDVARLAVHHAGIHTVGSLGEDTGVAHLGPPVIVTLVVEPEEIVVGLEQRHRTGGQEGRLRRSHGARLHVQLGELVTAGGQAHHREQGQCNEYFSCFHSTFPD